MMMYNLYRLYLLMILCKGFLEIDNFKILQAIHNDLIVVEVLNKYDVNHMLSNEWLMHVLM